MVHLDLVMAISDDYYDNHSSMPRNQYAKVVSMKTDGNYDQKIRTQKLILSCLKENDDEARSNREEGVE